MVKKPLKLKEKNEIILSEFTTTKFNILIIIFKDITIILEQAVLLLFTSVNIYLKDMTMVLVDTASP